LKNNIFALFWYGYFVVFRSKVPISGPNIAFYASNFFLEKGQLGNLFSVQILLHVEVSKAFLRHSHTQKNTLLRMKI